MPDRICIIGANGMLGRELVRACEASSPRIEHDALGKEAIDVSDPHAVTRVFERIRPRLVINAAAYTNVDGCESEREVAFAVNARGPENLAIACKALDSRLVHVSTDYVFDGKKGEPWEPDDPVGPQSVYGESKAEGERRIRQNLPNHVIVRTSWLYAAHGNNFVRTMLRLAGERPEIKVVDDQVGSPTHARDLAGALIKLGLGLWRGTYHFCNGGTCSWHEFAGEILRLAGCRTRVLPMRTAELNRPAPRPAYSVLSTAKLTEDTALRPRPWREVLAECIRDLSSVACG